MPQTTAAHNKGTFHKSTGRKPGDINIIVGCEYSQVVMTEFLKLGFNAYSCDKLPCEGDYPDRHIQADIFEVLKDKWDVGIFHPPCQFLSYAGMASYNKPGRVFERLKALDFFARLLYADIPRVCVENPLGIASRVVREHDQMFHPYYFGHDREMKRTCLWLNNLPKLVHIKQPDLFDQQTHLAKPEPYTVFPSGKKGYFMDSLRGKKNRAHLRSRSFYSIANAMATQWSSVLLDCPVYPPTP